MSECLPMIINTNNMNTHFILLIEHDLCLEILTINYCSGGCKDIHTCVFISFFIHLYNALHRYTVFIG